MAATALQTFSFHLKFFCAWHSSNSPWLMMQLAAVEALWSCPCTLHKQVSCKLNHLFFLVHALTQGERGSTQVVYTLFLKTVPFIKVQPRGMVLQQCPISRGKKCTYPFT